MKKMIGISLALMLMLSAIGLAAFDLNATKWSVHGKVTTDNIVDIFGNSGDDMLYVRGRLNSYVNMQRGFQTNGAIYINSADLNGDHLPRFSASWSDRDGAVLVSDDEDETVISAPARVIYGGIVYNEAITVVYDKASKTVDIIGSSFEFSDIGNSQECITMYPVTFCR